MSVAIIDGDELIFKTALAFQKKQYFVRRGDRRLYNVPSYEYAIESVCDDESLDIDSEIIVYPLGDYKSRLDSYISKILMTTYSTRYILCLSGDNNFRYNLATLLPYKGNRDASKRPVHLKAIRNLVKQDYDCKWVDQNEADELMVYESRKVHKSIICSSDKDLKTVSGRLYDITKGTLKFINPQEAQYNFYFQMLIGDAVDNIPSPYLLGKVKASKILDQLDINCSERTMYDWVKLHYEGYLTAKDKEGNYKTEWYSGQDIDEVLTEVGNLLWMEHIPGGKSRWSIPIDGTYNWEQT
jgi:hypothetical protein